MSVAKQLISIVIPVYNEEDNVRAAYDQVVEVMAGLGNAYDFEILFTDNHSADATFEIIRLLADKDSRVRCIRFSRNFGYQNSIFTGYLNARGDAAIQLDCDMQDPPKLIATFLERWSEGYEVVYGVRRSRKEGVASRLVRGFFYWLVDALSGDRLPRDAADFRLVSRRVLNELSKVRDQNLYLRGLIASLGFRQIGVPYDRGDRLSGASKFSFASLVGFAMNAIVGHSILPLRIASLVGMATALLTIFTIIGYASFKLFFPHDWPPGFATLAIMQVLAITLNALFLGIIGEYIGRIYMQVRNRPLTVIETVLNMDGADVQVIGRES